MLDQDPVNVLYYVNLSVIFTWDSYLVILNGVRWNRTVILDGVR